MNTKTIRDGVTDAIYAASNTAFSAAQTEGLTTKEKSDYREVERILESLARLITTATP